jgi:four helix bundle protein
MLSPHEDTIDGSTRHRRLVVWKQAMRLMLEVYTVVRRMPFEERFALAAQMRRAAVSVPANIAEGYGRVYRGDYVRHLSIARGSLAELETLPDAAECLGYSDRHQLASARRQVDAVGGMLTRMILRMKEGA